MIKYLNKETLLQKLNNLNDPYWKSYEERWKYMEWVIYELKTINPSSVLELGAYKINLTSISDNMDVKKENIDIDNIDNKTYIKRAEIVPWDISNKAYDVFVALQVFEHLKNKQSLVFKEIKRISKSAILSFPYKWNCPGNCHHMIDEDIIDKWTDHLKPKKTALIEKRIIYVFQF